MLPHTTGAGEYNDYDYMLTLAADGWTWSKPVRGGDRGGSHSHRDGSGSGSGRSVSPPERTEHSATKVGANEVCV